MKSVIIIIDHKKLNNSILNLLVKRFPHGYSTVDIIRFYTARYDEVDCVEVETDDTVYLVKIGSMLTKAIVSHNLETDIDLTD